MESQLKKLPSPLSDASLPSKGLRHSLQRHLIPGPLFELLDCQSNARAAAEGFIAERFRRHHQAVISEFLPTLVTLRRNSQLCAALGLRPAGGNHAEQAIATLIQSPLSRTGIIEIGNLVADRNGASSLLFLIVLAVVQRAGYQWVMFTGTPQLQRGILKMGFALQPICPASPEALPGDQRQWGNYYNNKPQVVAGFVAQSMAICNDNPQMAAILALFENDIAAMAAGLNGRAA